MNPWAIGAFVVAAVAIAANAGKAGKTGKQRATAGGVGPPRIPPAGPGWGSGGTGPHKRKRRAPIVWDEFQPIAHLAGKAALTYYGVDSPATERVAGDITRESFKRGQRDYMNTSGEL